MKIETITVMERKNLGNYEHIEITASARVEENDDAYSSLLTLKTLVHSALEGKAATMTSVPTAKVEEVKHEIVEEVPKKEKKAKKEKAPVEVKQEEAVVVEQEEVTPEPIGKNVVVYNSNIPEHKSIFAGHLSEKYGNTWKTANTPEKIKEFTTSLNGKHFLDDDGKIVSTFLSEVHGFFGA